MKTIITVLTLCLFGGLTPAMAGKGGGFAQSPHFAAVKECMEQGDESRESCCALFEDQDLTQKCMNKGRKGKRGRKGKHDGEYDHDADSHDHGAEPPELAEVMA